MTNNSLQESTSTTLSNKPHWPSIARIVMIVAVIGGGIWLWEDVLEDRIIPKRWGVVEPGKIYRSGQLSAALVRKTLSKHNIKVIVTLTGNTPGDKDKEAEIQAAAELDIEMLRFPLKGNGTGDINNYAQAIAAIVDARNKAKPVLVHCTAGAQRTGGVVACYRMIVEKKPPSFVYAELLRYDWRDKPDQVLLTYINNNMAQLAELLKQMGVIDQVPDPLPVIRSKYQRRVQ